MPHVVVDIHQWAALARRLVNLADHMDEHDLGAALGGIVRTELLPELDDEEWLNPERDRYRQLGLHALEALSKRLVKVGWHGAAVEAAFAAMRVDPLRESAHRMLINAYLAEGNLCDARRQYHAYRMLLRSELGVEPSARFTELVRDAGLRAESRSWPA